MRDLGLNVTGSFLGMVGIGGSKYSGYYCGI